LKTLSRQTNEDIGKSVMFGDVEISEGENIEFSHIDIISPDGKLLAEGIIVI
jgi:hypothetical protein